jgi:hypothetical protein
MTALRGPDFRTDDKAIRQLGQRAGIGPIADRAGLTRCAAAAIHRKDHVMSKFENDANNVFRPSDRPLTEYEKEQIALRKNLERLKAGRMARELAKSKDA